MHVMQARQSASPHRGGDGSGACCALGVGCGASAPLGLLDSLLDGLRGGSLGHCARTSAALEELPVVGVCR
jgi:hypothetical protein